MESSFSRIAEHESSIKNKTESTALYKHTVDNTLDLKNIKFLDTETSYKRILF